jgi:hypothetical protein
LSEATLRALLPKDRSAAKKLDVNCLGFQGMTPLHYAAKRGCVTSVELLLSQGATHWPRDHKGRFPIHLAITHGHHSVAKLLLGMHKTSRPEVVAWAISQNYAHAKSLCVRYGRHNENLRLLSTVHHCLIVQSFGAARAGPEANEQALHLAAVEGWKDVVAFLVEEVQVDIKAATNAKVG